MSSSPYVYDVAIDSIDADDAAAALSRVVRRSGLRCWSAAWSAVPGSPLADELRFAQSAARVTVRVIGSCRDLSDLERKRSIHESVIQQPSTVILAPGCRIGPDEIGANAGDAVIDGRSGLLAHRDELLVSLLRRPPETGEPIESGLDGSSIKSRVIASYDLIAEKFASRWTNHPPLAALEKFVRHLPVRAMVLDAGCGPGHHAAVLARWGHDVIGIDLSEGMLRIARRIARRPRFLRMDMQHLRFPERAFDGVWCAAAALHVPREDLVDVLRGFGRILRPSGVLGLNLQVGRASEVVSREGDTRFFEYYRDGNEVARLAGKAGFQVMASDYGETARNTHGLDVTLRWVTLFLRPLSLEMRSTPWAHNSTCCTSATAGSPSTWI